jgi:hypothetical protein
MWDLMSERADEVLQYRPMTDDALIAGAAAPTRKRWITSTARLDVLWVLAVSAMLVVSSLFDLIDLPNARLRTGEAPLRVFVVGIPLIACAIAAVAARRRSELLAAIATGVLAPGIALAGSLSMSLFLDEASAFADVGVAISLGAALLGLVMFVRWFVYHPLSLLGDEARPRRAVSLGLTVVGAALAASVVVTGLGDGVGLAWVGETAAMLFVPVLLMVSGPIRTVPAVGLAAAAAAAQILAVAVVKVEQSEIEWDSDLMLRTGVLGLFGLILAVVLAVVSIHGASPDDLVVEIDDDESWRWSVDD